MNYRMGRMSSVVDFPTLKLVLSVDITDIIHNTHANARENAHTFKTHTQSGVAMALL